MGECVVADGCLEAEGPLIKDEVDVIFDTDSGQLYSLYEAFEDVDHTLEVVVEEHEGDALGEPTEFTGYYPVAVVTAAWCEANPDATFDMLQGMRSCHTGYQKTAGWRASVGTLIKEGFVPVESSPDSTPADIHSFQEWIGSACVPGVAAEASDGAANPLCENCGGTDADFCAMVDGEPYYNYPGALRCLVEDAGDVAFIRQRTPPEYLNTGEENSFDPSWNYVNGDSMDDYKLLCLEGGCQPLSAFTQCSFPKTFGHTVVASSDSEEVQALRTALSELSASSPEFQETFLSGGSLQGALFTDGATYLQTVEETVEEFAGDMFASWEEIDQLVSGEESSDK